MFQSRFTIPRPHRNPFAGPVASAVGSLDRAPRHHDARRSRPSATLDGFEPARAYFAACFATVDASRESLFIAYLDRAARCIRLSRNEGTAGGVEWPLRAVLLEAARCNAAGLIVAHNHPSGDPTPSPSDRATTRRLAVAADAIDVTLVDHLLFAGEDCVSFRRLGLI